MIKLLATDLDGTIHTRNNGFNKRDIDTLKTIGKNGMLRVIATGRTFQSALSVLPDDFPIDYLVFSSGAGIYDWHKKEMLHTCNLGFENSKHVIGILNENKVEYTVHHPIPDNHIFFHSVAPDPHPDFERYIEFNKVHAIPEEQELAQLDYSQTLAFVDNMTVFDKIKAQLKGVKTIRATSPIDGNSIWMECFNTKVSKAMGIKWLCDLLNINSNDVVAIGNDYNDLDMLNYFPEAYVVANAPKELRQQYKHLNDVTSAPLADWYKRHH